MNIQRPIHMLQNYIFEAQRSTDHCRLLLQIIPPRQNAIIDDFRPLNQVLDRFVKNTQTTLPDFGAPQLALFYPSVDRPSTDTQAFRRLIYAQEQFVHTEPP
jgi:hypothetical protein